MSWLRVALIAVIGLCPVWAWAETRLMMGEQPGCYWCALWDKEIAPIYPKTAEGRAAPLRRFNIHAPPADVRFMRRVTFTPTFVLVRDGEELGRIEGYPGEDFFWGLLNRMMTEGGVSIIEGGSSAS